MDRGGRLTLRSRLSIILVVLEERGDMLVVRVKELCYVRNVMTINTVEHGDKMIVMTADVDVDLEDS